MSRPDNLSHPEGHFRSPDLFRRLVKAAQPQGKQIDASMMMPVKIEPFILFWAIAYDGLMSIKQESLRAATEPPAVA